MSLFFIPWSKTVPSNKINQFPNIPPKYLKTKTILSTKVLNNTSRPACQILNGVGNQYTCNYKQMSSLQTDVCTIGSTCMRSQEVSIYDDCLYCNLDTPTEWSVKAGSRCEHHLDNKEEDEEEDMMLRNILIGAGLVLVVVVMILLVALIVTIKRWVGFGIMVKSCWLETWIFLSTLFSLPVILNQDVKYCLIVKSNTIYTRR